jgi:hypothetical protein
MGCSPHGRSYESSLRQQVTVTMGMESEREGSDFGESTTHKLFLSPFPQQFLVNGRLPRHQCRRIQPSLPRQGVFLAALLPEEVQRGRVSLITQGDAGLIPCAVGGQHSGHQTVVNIYHSTVMNGTPLYTSKRTAKSLWQQSVGYWAAGCGRGRDEKRVEA